MPKTRVNCKIRICEERNGRFCYDCAQFPCKTLKHLDLRYRTKYGMSEIDNLQFIRDNGMKEFLQDQRRRFESERGILCVHNKTYH